MTRGCARRAAGRGLAIPAIVMAATVMVLGGCAALPRGPEAAAHTFLLEAGIPDAAHRGKPEGTLLVAPVAARSGYDTAAMAYIARPHEIRYFALNRWVDAPARMMAPLLVKALESTGRFAMVQSAPGAVRADLRLDIELVRLHQDFTQTPSAVHFVLRAALIDLNSRRLLGVQDMEAVETAPNEAPYGGVVAANRALARLLKETAAFCLRVAG